MLSFILIGKKIYLIILYNFVSFFFSVGVNKKTLIQFIQDKKLNILHQNVKHKTEWKIIKQLNLQHTIGIKHLDTSTEIRCGDVYKIKGKRHKIEHINYIDVIVSLNIDLVRIPMADFVEMLDADDTVIELNQLRRKKHI